MFGQTAGGSKQSCDRKDLRLIMTAVLSLAAWGLCRGCQLRDRGTEVQDDAYVIIPTAAMGAGNVGRSLSTRYWVLRTCRSFGAAPGSFIFFSLFFFFLSEPSWVVKDSLHQNCNNSLLCRRVEIYLLTHLPGIDAYHCLSKLIIEDSHSVLMISK